jgi:integrase
MAKIILKKRKSTDNFGDVYIRYIKDKKQKVFSLNLTITEIDFNNLFVKENINQFKKTTKFNYKEINKLIIDNIDKDVFSLPTKSPVTLISYFEEQIPLVLNPATRTNYIQTLKNITKYLTTINKLDINFDEIDRDFIKKYKKWLVEVKKNTPNSVSQNLTLVRAMLNIANDDKNVTYKMDNDLFKKMIKRTSAAKKEMPTMDDVKKIMNMKSTDLFYNESNIFLMGVALCGLRANDLFFLKYGDFKNKTVSIIASKTKKPLDIEYSPLIINVLAKILNIDKNNPLTYTNYISKLYEFLENSDGNNNNEFEPLVLNSPEQEKFLKEKILKVLKSKDPNQYLFSDFLNSNIFDNYDKMLGMNDEQFRKYSTKRTRYNESLIKICKMNKLTIKKMTSHYSRYIAVMILIEDGFDFLKISKILQHAKVQQTIDYIKNNYDEDYIKEASQIIGKSI